jgi:hypothetical protein
LAKNANNVGDVTKASKGKVDGFANKPFLPDEAYRKISLSLLNQELIVSISMMN